MNLRAHAFFHFVGNRIHRIAARLIQIHFIHVIPGINRIFLNQTVVINNSDSFRQNRGNADSRRNFRKCIIFDTRSVPHFIQSSHCQRIGANLASGGVRPRCHHNILRAFFRFDDCKSLTVKRFSVIARIAVIMII